MLFIFFFDLTGLNKTNRRKVYKFSYWIVCCIYPQTETIFFCVALCWLSLKKSTFTNGYLAKTKQNILRLFDGKYLSRSAHRIDYLKLTESIFFKINNSETHALFKGRILLKC